MNNPNDLALWVPHGGDFPYDPLVTPKTSNGGFLNVGGHTFPPLPSPTNAGLLPLITARGSHNQNQLPLPQPSLITPRTVAAIAASVATATSAPQLANYTSGGMFAVHQHTHRGGSRLASIATHQPSVLGKRNSSEPLDSKGTSAAREKVEDVYHSSTT
jgi:hypothetical protein